MAASEAVEAVAAIAQKNALLASPGEELDSLEPSQGFTAARAAASKLHVILQRLKDDKINGEGTSSEFSDSAREMQAQLMALRRAHRAMVTCQDAGRVNEASARRAADGEYAHLETRQYESACCRAAARRCRNLPTPQLNKLRPLLDGFQDEDDDDVIYDYGAAAEKRLQAKQLEAELRERTRLAEELAGLERQRNIELRGFREREKLGAELSAKLSNVSRSLEPVCDLLDLRPRSGTTDDLASKLPAPLRLVYSKFEALGTDKGTAVTIEEAIAVEAKTNTAEETAPSEKKRRLEAADPGQLTVAVQISGSSSQETTTLRFANPSQSLVTVAAEAFAGESLLDDLWPEDDGRHVTMTSLLPSSVLEKGCRPYGWAQVLAGLREEALAAIPALHAMEAVKAEDVVARIQAKLKDSKSEVEIVAS